MSQLGLRRRQRAAEVGDGLSLPRVSLLCDLRPKRRAAPAVRSRLLGVPEPDLGILKLLEEDDVVAPRNL